MTQSDKTNRSSDVEKEAPIIQSKIVIYGITSLVILGSWEIMAQFAFEDLQTVIPPLGAIFASLFEIVTTGVILPHLITTAKEVVIGVILAGIVGIIGGTILGKNEFVGEAVEPLVYYFSTVPKIVIYPILLMIFGVGLESKIAMGFLSAIFPILVNTIIGARSVRDDLVKVAKVYQASSWELFKTVYLPSSISHVINGFRLGIGGAIIVVLLGEIFASQSGLGNLIHLYFTNLQMSRMYAVLIIIFILSMSINLSILRVQNLLGDRGYGHSKSEDSFGF